MKYKWTILPLTLAIIGCVDEKDNEPTPNYKEFTISGELHGARNNYGAVAIYAGNQLLGSVDSSHRGSYNLPVNINDSIYQKVRNERLYLISTADSIQLASYLNFSLQDAVSLGHLSGNLSSLSTSQYIVADLNDDGIISQEEWRQFSENKHSDTVNSSILQFSSSLQTVLEGLADSNSTGSLSWLTGLKSGTQWNTWSLENSEALAQSWSLLFSEPLASEINNVLELGTGILDDWYQKNDEVLGSKPARCDLTIIPPGDVDPHKGRVGDSWTLSSYITDRVTGSQIAGQSPSWTTDNTYVASVSSNGLVNLNGAGSASVSASYSYGGESCIDTFNITVFERDEIVDLDRIQIDLDVEEISVNEQVHLSAIAYWSNDTASDISNVITWSTEPAENADIDDQWLTAIKPGTLIIRANYDGKQDVTTLTIRDEDVLPPQLESLSLSGYDSPKKPGESWQLTATGFYDDESSRDLTYSATWTSSNSTIATVANGTVIANAPGQATIKAMISGFEQSQTVTVLEEDIVEPEIVSITLLGNNENKPVGEKWHLSAEALFDNDDTRDVTTQAQWRSSNSDILTVHQGVVEAVGEGSATITVSLHGLSDNTTLTVEAYEAELVDIILTTGETILFAGDSSVWGATATFDDESELDFSRRAQWTSSNEAIASVVHGIVTAHAEGKVTITASHKGKQDSTELTVEALSLESVSISSGSEALRVGESTTFVAMGSYNNGQEIDVSRRGQWSSDNSTVAHVMSGVTKAIGVGQASINFELDTQSASAALTVTTDAPQLVGLAINGDTGQIEKNDSRQLTARASFDNNDEFDVIPEWISSNSNVLTVNAAGMISAKEIGSATITAKYQEQTSATVIEVISDEPVLVGLEISGDVGHFRKGDILQLTATAHFDRGDSQNVTTDVSWRSTGDQYVTVEHGLIEGIAPGNANIIAEWQGERDSLEVMVLLPDLVSIEPSIFNNEMTMVEGDIHPGQLVLSFSDGTTLDYSHAISNYYVNTDYDQSSKRIANYLNSSARKEGFRAFRAGETRFRIDLSGDETELIESLRYAGIEVSGSASSPQVNVDLTVQHNANTYMWHRMNLGSERNHTATGQVFYDEKLYQFWSKSENSVLQGIYVTEFDGESISDYTLILEGLKLNSDMSRVLSDGGGNGYVLLKTENANRVTDQYIYNLETSEIHLIDFSSVDFTQVAMTQRRDVYSFTEDGLLNYHQLHTSNPRRLVTYQYNPESKEWITLNERSHDHGNYTWIHQFDSDKHYILLDTNSSTNSSGGYRPPELSYVNRDSGKIDKVKTFVYPTQAEGRYCYNMTTSMNTGFQLQFENGVVRAYCFASVSNGHDEYWLWDDITKFPEVFTRDEREAWSTRTQFNIAKHEDLLVAHATTYKDSPGNTWREAHEWDTFEFTTNVVQLPNLSNSTSVNNEFNDTHKNYDVSNLSLLNPKANNELLMISYGTLMVQDSETGEFLDDEALFGLPTSITSNKRLYKMNGTWYLFEAVHTNSGTNYFWRLQLRDPEALPH